MSSPIIYPFINLDPPVGKYKEIFDYVLRLSGDVKQADLCCGLGFGKTLVAIQVAALTLDIDGNQRGLFLEPDWDRVNDIFIPKWLEHVPEDLYEISIGKNRINWHNGSYLIYRPRVITGSKQRSRDKFRGIELTFVVDDETAIGFDLQQYQNTFARIRADSKVRYYFTLSTPLVGPYGRFIKRGGNKLFRGKTSDNHYLLSRDPGYEDRQRKNMSPDQARRELDGELIALEGRIWKNTDRNKAWPKGNRHDTFTGFDKSKPWWLFCDLGGATGAYVVVQATDAEYRGRVLFPGTVWVAVADYCPDDDANASRAFQKLKMEFGIPVAVVAGKDINTRDRGDGYTVSYFVENIFGSKVAIFPVDESHHMRRIQYNCLDWLMLTATGERRFTVARKFVSLDSESNRGVREMIDEDAWLPMDVRRVGDILPKDRKNTVQHVRDALLMGAYAIMAPPSWHEKNNPTG